MPGGEPDAVRRRLPLKPPAVNLIHRAVMAAVPGADTLGGQAMVSVANAFVHIAQKAGYISSGRLDVFLDLAHAAYARKEDCTMRMASLMLCSVAVCR